MKSRFMAPLAALLWFATTAQPTAAADLPTTTAAPDCPRALTLDPEALAAEAVCLVRAYVSIDTTNPPGHELTTAHFLQAVLQREGIASTVFESVPGRANLYARLHGDGSAKALMLVHHMDVVPADTTDWSVPPFAGLVREGYVWGRGTLDNKGPGVMELLAFVMLKRLGVALARDVVLLGVADEEQGGGKGARYMVEAHADLFADVEFALNEGGVMLDLPGSHTLYAVEFAQKVPLWLKLTANGPAGHASAPKPEAATHRLVRALARLEQLQFPLVVVPAVQTVFDHRAAAMPADQRAPYANLAASLRDNAEFRARFMADPHNAAMVRNSLAITMLSGSSKENVYSAQASAVLDLRLLPGQDPQAVIAELQRVMQESAVTIAPLLTASAHTVALDTELYKAIGALVARHTPGAVISPSFISGFTDCNTFRGAGIACYGFMPMHLPLAEIERVHGRDERIAIDQLAPATLLLHELVRDVAARR